VLAPSGYAPGHRVVDHCGEAAVFRAAAGAQGFSAAVESAMTSALRVASQPHRCPAVVVSNLHLASPKEVSDALRVALTALAAASDANAELRVYFTAAADPSPSAPAPAALLPLLPSVHRLWVTAPVGARPQARRAVAALPRSAFVPVEKGRLHALLCAAHAVILRRAALAPAGFSEPVAFGHSDLASAQRLVDDLVDAAAGPGRAHIAPSELPLATIRRAVRVAGYGARLSRQSDRDAVDLIVNAMLSDSAFADAEGALLPLASCPASLKPPPVTAHSLSALVEWTAEAFPPDETAASVGLLPSATRDAAASVGAEASASFGQLRALLADEAHVSASNAQSDSGLLVQLETAAAALAAAIEVAGALPIAVPESLLSDAHATLACLRTAIADTRLSGQPSIAGPRLPAAVALRAFLAHSTLWAPLVSADAKGGAVGATAGASGPLPPLTPAKDVVDRLVANADAISDALSSSALVQPAAPAPEAESRLLLTSAVDPSAPITAVPFGALLQPRALLARLLLAAASVLELSVQAVSCVAVDADSAQLQGYPRVRLAHATVSGLSRAAEVFAPADVTEDITIDLIFIPTAILALPEGHVELPCVVKPIATCRQRALSLFPAWLPVKSDADNVAIAVTLHNSHVALC
jgi:hypothetical protein